MYLRTLLNTIYHFITLSSHYPISPSLHMAHIKAVERTKGFLFFTPYLISKEYINLRLSRNVQFIEYCITRGKSQSSILYLFFWKLNTFTELTNSRNVQHLSKVYYYFMNNG